MIFIIALPTSYSLYYLIRHNRPPGKIGGPEDVYTLGNYRYRLFCSPTSPDAFNYLHLEVFLRTIVVSVFITLLDFALCYPIAYYIAQVAKGGFARAMILLLILPFWVNEILRAFAFRILFGTSGVINAMLQSLGLVDQPIDFIRADRSEEHTSELNYSH